MDITEPDPTALVFAPTFSPPHSTSALLSLPTELLSHITSYLDPSSALSLLVTHSRLLIASESRLWSAISLGDPYTRAHFTHLSRLVPSSHVLRPEPDPAVIEQWPRSAAVRRFFIYLLDLLHAKPYRRALVRSIELELGYLIPAETVDILNLVSGGLERLSLGYPLVAAARYPKWAFVSTSRLFAGLSTPLTALRHVEISILAEWDSTVLGLLNAAPNLVFLKINSHHPSLITNDPDPSPDPLVPPMHKLRTLIVESMRPTFTALLERLIRGSPNLTTVALRAPTFLWQPASDDPVLVALGTSPALSHLELTSDCLGALSTPGHFPSLTHLAVLWKLTHVEDHVRDGWVIPPLPLLQRYQINVSQLSSYWSTQGSDAFLHLHAGPKDFALSAAAEQLHKFPHLTVVSAPLRDLFLRGDKMKHGTTVEPSDAACDWRHEKFRGLVVASFVPTFNNATNTARSQTKPEIWTAAPDDVQVGDTDELIHYRAKISGPGECTGLAGCPCKLEWQEGAFFNGRRVPLNVLAAIYAASGSSMAQFEAGRGRELESAGWEVLRHWLVQEGI